MQMVKENNFFNEYALNRSKLLSNFKPPIFQSYNPKNDSS